METPFVEVRILLPIPLVSEGLNSVETFIELVQVLPIEAEFQKDLIVWKHSFVWDGSDIDYDVSEGLNSVETDRRKNNSLWRDNGFQKDLIVWKLTQSIEWNPETMQFQKDLIVWKLEMGGRKASLDY